MLQFDAPSIKQRLQDRTRQNFGDVEIVFFGTNDHLFDVVSEELAEAMRYDEYLTIESKWRKAQMLSSIMAQVEFYPYIPHRKVGAKGEVRFSVSETFDGSHVDNIVIPKFTQISNGTRSVVTTEEVVLPASVNYVDVPVVQGRLVTYSKKITTTDYPAGTVYARVIFDNANLDDEIYDVYVNGIKYEEVSNIRLAESGDAQVYTLQNKQDFSGIVVQFGNGFFGVQLEIGDTVELRAVETEGSLGNILRLNSLTQITGSFVDAFNLPIKLYAKNPVAIVGGSDYEAKESIKANAPRSFQSGSRATGNKDYKTLILAGKYADICNVWGADEVNEELGNPPGTYLPKEENMVYVTGYTFDSQTLRGTPITTTQQTQIRREINALKSPTDIVHFIDSQFVYVVFHINASITDMKYTEQAVRANIHSALRENYALGAGIYKRHLRHSNYQRVLDQVEGVHHHQTYVSFQSFHLMKGNYVFDLNLDIDNIKPNTLKFYIRDVQTSDWSLFAIDDGVGNLVGQLIDPEQPELGSYELPGAVFDYLDGNAGEVIISYGLSQDYTNYEIRVDFEVEDSLQGDLILTKMNQVFGYIKNDTTIEFRPDDVVE